MDTTSIRATIQSTIESFQSEITRLRTALQILNGRATTTTPTAQTEPAPSTRRRSRRKALFAPGALTDAVRETVSQSKTPLSTTEVCARVWAKVNYRRTLRDIKLSARKVLMTGRREGLFASSPYPNAKPSHKHELQWTLAQ